MQPDPPMWRVFLCWVGAGKTLEQSSTSNRPVSHAEKKSPAENNSNQQMAFDVNQILADLWGSSYALGAYLGAYLKILFARLAVVAAYWRLFDRRRLHQITVSQRITKHQKPA